MTRISRHALVLLAAFGLAVAAPAQAASTTQELVEKARFTVEKMLADPEMGMLVRTLKEAKGVLIIPSLLKAGFLFGAEGGSGVLLSRDANGEWSYPAFVTLGAASFGLQAGVQDSQVIFTIMTERGLDAVVRTEVKLGVDASVTVGSIGTGLEGSMTTGFGADIAAFSLSRGLFGGGAIEGGVIRERADWNREYYGAEATARAIIFYHQFSNPDADGLRAALAAIQ